MTIDLQSTVSSSLKRRVLLRGAWLAALGAGLLFTVIFIPESHLTFWGFPLFIAAGSLIVLGLLPYRRLMRLEVNPYRLETSSEESLLYSIAQRPLCLLPLQSIERLGYWEGPKEYGIQIWWKSPLPCKIVVQDKRFDISGWQEVSRKKYGCDFFLPYFSLRSFKTLNEML